MLNLLLNSSDIDELAKGAYGGAEIQASRQSMQVTIATLRAATTRQHHTERISLTNRFHVAESLQ